MLHAGVTITTGRGANKKVEVLSIPFVKKYIQYAKSRIKPVLTQEASDRITEIYVALRNDDMKGNERKTSPMTVRTLETIIRLATAHAKARLSNRVEERDALAAESILRFALFKEVLEDEKKSKRRKTRPLENESSGNESSSSDDDSPPPTTRAGSSRTPQGTARTRALANGRRSGLSGTNGTTGHSNGDNGGDVPSEEDDIYTATPRTTQRSRLNGTNGTAPSLSQPSFASSLPASQLPSQSQSQSQEDSELADGAAALSIAPAITPGRFTVFRNTLGQLLNTALFEDDSAEVTNIIAAVNRTIGGAAGGAYDRAEAEAALRKMDEANNIMYTDGDLVYKI